MAARKPTPEVLEASDPATSPDRLAQLAAHKSLPVRRAVADNPGARLATLFALAKEFPTQVANNSAVWLGMLENPQLLSSDALGFKEALTLAKVHPLPEVIWAGLYDRQQLEIQRALLENPSAPADAWQRAWGDPSSLMVQWYRRHKTPYMPVGPRGLIAFLNSETSLYSHGVLSLEGMALGDEGARALAGWDGLEHIYSLHLVNNGIGPEGARALAASPYLVRINSLSLSQNPLGDEGVAALAGARFLSPETLRLEGVDMDGSAFGPLARSPVLAKLDTLHAKGNRILSAAVAELVGAPSFRLDGLFLEGNPIDDRGAFAIARSPLSVSLGHLDLAKTQIGEAGMVALTESPYLVNVRVLDLTGIKVTSKAHYALRAFRNAYTPTVLHGRRTHREVLYDGW